MSKQQALDEIASQIIAEKVCPELAAEATQLVPGDGNPDAEVVLIGEAPGKSEDAQGLPFVGAAGKFLNEMLAHAGLKREDVFITNIVKYRPPGNRDPLPEEKAAFWPYLLRQLMVIKPKLVVTLGRHSMEYFLPNQKISQIHGQPKRIRFKNAKNHSRPGDKGVDGMQGAGEARTEPYEEYGEGALEQATQQAATKLGRASGSARRQDELTLVILPLYHPAAALYNGSMRATLLEDFMRMPAILDLIKDKEIN